MLSVFLISNRLNPTDRSGGTEYGLVKVTVFEVSVRGCLGPHISWV